MYRLAASKLLRADARLLQSVDDAPEIVSAPKDRAASLNEAAIQTAVAALTRGRTTFVVAHRLSTIRHADRILVIRDGAIAEQGTHDALLRRDGLYARLWAKQVGAQAQEGGLVDLTEETEGGQGEE